MAKKSPEKKTTKKPAAKERPAMPTNPFDQQAEAPETTPLEGFPISICKKLRRLRNLSAEYKRKRAEAFQTRDGAKAELQELGPRGNKEKREAWEAVVGRADIEIERLKKSISWANSEVYSTIDAADDPKLIDDVDENPTPPQSLFEVKPKRDAATVGGDEGEPNPDQGEFGGEDDPDGD